MGRWIVAATIASLAGPASAQGPSLEEVLGKGMAYVADFERQLTGIVAEETYTQEMLAFTPRPGQLVDPVRTQLKSDLLLVRTGGDGYLEFRDVFAVDGRPVRDRAERLTRLFQDASPANEARKMRIREENARYNIGDVVRTINTPLMALQVLERRNRPGFRFSRTREREPRVAGEGTLPPGAFRVSTDVWVVEYREHQRGTLIRTTDGRDLPARGRLWIEADTGRVLMTELVASNRDVKAEVTVSFKSEPLVGLLVPVEMRETYKTRTGSLIRTTATYGKFRQFPVK
jgi:hypothetical protein